MENPEKKSHLSTIGVPILVAVMVIGLIVVGFLIVKKTFFDKGKIIVQNPTDVVTSEISVSGQEGADMKITSMQPNMKERRGPETSITAKHCRKQSFSMNCSVPAICPNRPAATGEGIRQ